MNYGICNLSIVPLRIEPNDRSEMVSQVLFGEHFKVIDKSKQWRKIRLSYDKYEGWIDEKQYLDITKEYYQLLDKATVTVTSQLVNFISDKKNELIPIVLGATLPSFEEGQFRLSEKEYTFDGQVTSKKGTKDDIIKTTFLYSNAPYLWGGKTPFGIDCSGFTQMVYKINGIKLLRDASQQASQGEVLSFIEESEPGDLAFFDNKEGEIIHVGIIMANNYIIHASGNVRIDRLDQSGIFNEKLRKHTHKLRVIKKIF